MPGSFQSGRRNGEGPAAFERGAFRAWCKKVALDPVVQKLMHETAKTNPEFALKVCEHAYGRPPQALDITTPDHPIGGVTVLAPVAASEVSLEEIEAAVE